MKTLVYQREYCSICHDPLPIDGGDWRVDREATCKDCHAEFVRLSRELIETQHKADMLRETITLWSIGVMVFVLGSLVVCLASGAWY